MVFSHFSQLECQCMEVAKMDVQQDEQAVRIRERMMLFDWENMSMGDFEEVFEDRDPFEFI